MSANLGAGGTWWANMPLPPGWEAKYDQNTRKYFFMHHSTRSTQWVDPRKAYYEQQRGGGIAPGPAPTMPHQRSPRMPMPPGRPIPMQQITKPKCKTCKRNEVPSAHQECQNCQLQARQREAELVRAREAEEAERKRKENQQRIQKEQERRRVQSAARARTPTTQPTHTTTSFFVPSDTEEPEVQELTEGQKRTIIRNLDEAFPGVERNVVEMVLESSAWDADKASSVLRTMSKQKPSQPKAKPTAATAVKAKASPAATPLQPSAASKSKMRAYVKKTFPDASDTLIELALETTKFDQGKACAVLRMTYESDSKPKKVTPEAKTTIPSPPAPIMSTKRLLERFAGEPTPSVPSASVSVSEPPRATTSTSVTPSRPKDKPVASPTPSPSAKASTSVKATAKTSRSRSAERAPKEAFISPFGCRPKGPDRSLVTGPNQDNLISSYIKIAGTDRSIVEGPKKDNVIGPSPSVGRDVTMAMGPQGGHYTGPQASLAKGSMYTANRQM